MFYREAGDFKTSYAADNQTFPIRFDRYRYYFVLLVSFLVIPFIINDYWASAIFLPFLIYAIAAIGLNILVGYCGQVSLGTGGFMAVGAYACYKFMTGFPEINIFFHVHLFRGGSRRLSVFCSVCRRCASRGSTSRWRRSRRSSSSSGSSTGCRGSTTTLPRVRSTRRNARCSASRSPVPTPKLGRFTCSALSSWSGAPSLPVT